MSRRFLASVLCGVAITVTAGSALAQAQNPAAGQANQQPAATARPAPTPPKKPGQLVNVKIEFAISDEQRGGAPPVKRMVSLIVADGESGSVRSQPDVFQ